MKRKICNFANASLEPTRKSAIFQRGQYYVERKTDRSRDPFKYAIFINDSLLGFTGQIANAKRFCQNMYISQPFATDTDYKDPKDPQAFERVFLKLSKKYRIKARPTMKKNQERKPKAKAKPKAMPKAKAKAKAKISKAFIGKPRQEFLFDTDPVQVSMDAIRLVIDEPTAKRAMDIIRDFEINGQFRTQKDKKKVIKALNEKRREFIIRNIKRVSEGIQTRDDVVRRIENAKRNPTKRLEKYFRSSGTMRDNETLEQFLNDFDSPLFRLIEMYLETWK